MPCGKLSGAEVKFNTPLIPAFMIGTTSDGAMRVGDEITTMLMSIDETTSSNRSMW